MAHANEVADAAARVLRNSPNLDDAKRAFKGVWTAFGASGAAARWYSAEGYCDVRDFRLFHAEFSKMAKGPGKTQYAVAFRKRLVLCLLYRLATAVSRAWHVRTLAPKNSDHDPEHKKSKGHNVHHAQVLNEIYHLAHLMNNAVYQLTGGGDANFDKVKAFLGVAKYFLVPDRTFPYWRQFNGWTREERLVPNLYMRMQVNKNHGFSSYVKGLLQENLGKVPRYNKNPLLVPHRLKNRGHTKAEDDENFNKAMVYRKSRQAQVAFDKRLYRNDDKRWRLLNWYVSTTGDAPSEEFKAELDVRMRRAAVAALAAKQRAEALQKSKKKREERQRMKNKTIDPTMAMILNFGKKKR